MGSINIISKSKHLLVSHSLFSSPAPFDKIFSTVTLFWPETPLFCSWNVSSSCVPTVFPKALPSAWRDLPPDFTLLPFVYMWVLVHKALSLRWLSPQFKLAPLWLPCYFLSHLLIYILIALITYFNNCPFISVFPWCIFPSRLGTQRGQRPCMSCLPPCLYKLALCLT